MIEDCDVMAKRVLSEVDYDQTSKLFGGKNIVYTLSFAFRDSGISDLLFDCEYFKPFIDEAVDTNIFNAFYMNALIVKNGSSVKRHVDTTLTRYIKSHTRAQKVSVLYLKIPDDMKGGELNIYRQGSVEKVKPETGKLVSFNGNPHEVSPTFTDHERISLVLESYLLTEDQYYKIPKYHRL